MLLKFHNYELKSFGELLYELELKGKESRMRSRFLAILEQQLGLIAQEREVLMKDYAKKDEQGEPIIEQDDEGQSFIVLEDRITFNIEATKLMSEEFIIQVNDNNKEMIKVVQDVVLNIDKVFSGVEAEKYNRFCDILEAVNID